MTSLPAILIDSPLSVHALPTASAVSFPTLRGQAREARDLSVPEATGVEVLAARLHAFADTDVSLVCLGVSLRNVDQASLAWARIRAAPPPGNAVLAVHPEAVRGVGLFVGPVSLDGRRLERAFVNRGDISAAPGTIPSDVGIAAGACLGAAAGIDRAMWDIVPLSEHTITTLEHLALAVEGKPDAVRVGVTIAVVSRANSVAYVTFDDVDVPVGSST